MAKSDVMADDTTSMSCLYVPSLSLKNFLTASHWWGVDIAIIIIIMYIYHALINALSAHMIHINLNMIFYTHVKHSPTKTIYIKYYLKNK